MAKAPKPNKENSSANTGFEAPKVEEPSKLSSLGGLPSLSGGNPGGVRGSQLPSISQGFNQVTNITDMKAEEDGDDDGWGDGWGESPAKPKKDLNYNEFDLNKLDQEEL